MEVAWHLINDPDPRRGGAQRILREAALNSEIILSQKSGRNTFYGKVFGKHSWIPFLIVKIIKKRPKTVFIHSRCFLPLSLILRAFKSKVIFYAHANYKHGNLLFRVFRCDQYIAVSDAVKKLLESNKILSSRITVIRNPYLAGKNVLQNHDKRSEHLNIACIGSLNPWKGVYLLADKLLKIAEYQKSKICLTVVGDGPEKESIANLSSRSKYFETRLLGFQEAPYEHISNISIVAIPSLEEGFGLVAIESIYQGKIVIYSDIPALREVCKDQSLCFPFSHSDQDSLIKAIRSSIEKSIDSSPPALMKDRSERILEEYGKDKFIQQQLAFRARLNNLL
ncbi:glycosyltransferase family 4 protein [Pseudomonas sp. TCU-HL1]|uniref:glycosyltransferase family 4 protein n=1 Tax=Pseudomonas sp. TCU-HL1 TaxID=1856685 RepID=UPI000856F477|nr:glycosyltransferase family 4 protein [Pseudomonas sp. TCU-HL1]AOE83346.1 hypothetical protein THL1_798 [Pseudomonas sp. TCU-HL1]